MTTSTQVQSSGAAPILGSSSLDGTLMKGADLLSFNEAQDEKGVNREHWRYLLNSVEEMGAEAFQERRQTLDRMLRDEGATYNDYTDGPGGKAWTLDPIPLVIDSHEWNSIESGVRERAELLNLILKDLYGPRNLLKLGILPPELVFSHRGFLRSCQGISMPGEQHLIQYAADIVRAPDGKMRLLSDRTQAPSGMGYALQNRTVMSRVFPSLFRDSHAHRLSLYFQSLRQKLNELNPNGDAARVVVLTPGTFNETYFEHVYLANYLGYSLVQGSDLSVRDGYVWIKTLDGLSRVDVILRRVDEYYCDPVELKGDSQLGVPGLLEVIRAGRVAVANPLGSGFLENHGLLRYLPAAANHFLGRDLAIESVPTYWCGDEKDLQYTLENIDNLVVKPTYRGPAFQVVHGGSLSTSKLEELKELIQANPLHYVAQEYIAPSTAPVWETDKWVQRPTVLRSFAIAGESSYTVMPGGLTRFSTKSDLVEITNKMGSLSKDTWILASEPEKLPSLIGAGEIPISRPAEDTADLPSRVVENLYWAGRYAERAESALRLLRTVFGTINSKESYNTQSQTMLLRAITHVTCTYPGFVQEKSTGSDIENELLAVVIDPNRLGSVASSVAALLNATDQVKDFLSSDTQRILRDLQDEMATIPDQLKRNFNLAPEEELNSLVTTLRALAGSMQESMTRGPGWHFLETGRRIERTLQTVSLLRALWVPAISYQDQYVVLESVLLSTEALITYRRRYQRQMDIANGLDLLLLEESNPRSITFQLTQLGGHIKFMPNGQHSSRLSSEEALLLEATTSLKLADATQLAEIKKSDFLRADLDQMLSRMQHLMNSLAEAISDKHFDHSAGPQPLAKQDWEDSF